MKKLFSTYWGLFTVAGLIIALDQWTKWLVRTNIPFAHQWLPSGLEWLMPYARLVYWHNSGAAFGMFQNGAYIFTGLAFLVIGLIVYYYPQIDAQDWVLRLALSMQLGGALGNLIDRLTQNFKVTDFISVGTFPVFNVADSSITVGTIVLLIGVWLNEKRLKQEQEAANDEPVENHGSV